MTIFERPQQMNLFRWVVLALVVAVSATFVPLWAPLVLASWIAAIARPLLARVARITGGRRRAAGALVVVLVVLMILPLAGAIVSLTRGAIDLVQSVLKSQGAKEALIAIAAGGDGGKDSGGDLLEAMKSPQRIIGLVQDYGGQALQIAGGIAGAASKAVLGLFVFVYAVYVFLVDGPTLGEWLEKHSPLAEEPTRRFVGAFHETGRGLLVGVGLTGLAQGIVATITYVTLGVPRALVLGLLTCVASLLPSIGTGLVWVPVAVGLLLAGKTGAAVIMAVVGVAVIGTIDNFLRPLFSRFGKLQLSSFMLLTSILGGVAAFGAGGLLLGPLFARLAKEALVLAREQRESLSDRASGR
jgi:predicted PurR-regulated permease PerM